MKIDLSEDFQHLTNAPIHEAAMEFRCDTDWRWKPEDFIKAAAEKLKAYTNPLKIQHFQHEIEIEIGATESTKTVTQFDGVRMESPDKTLVVVLKRNGFAFSRLKPYENFARFIEAATPCWDVYRELVPVANVRRVGLRFINKVPLTTPHFGTLLRNPPHAPQGLEELPFAKFVHQDSYAVEAATPFVVNVTNMIEPTNRSALVVDIDVQTTGSYRASPENAFAPLQEMRWLKNKMFFGIMSDEAIEGFK